MGTIVKSIKSTPSDIEQRRARSREYRAKALTAFREYIAEAKDVPCADCGLRYPAYVMDFDHIKGEKQFGIAQAIKSTHRLETLITEIEKCEVVCSNCHRERTHNGNNS